MLWAASSTLNAPEQAKPDAAARADQEGMTDAQRASGCCIVIDSLQTFYDVASGDADAVCIPNRNNPNAPSRA